jgi:ribosomal protein L24
MEITTGTQVYITSGFAAGMTGTVEAVYTYTATVSLPGYGVRTLPRDIMEAVTW